MSTFLLSPATSNDADFLYRLSMEPTVRANSVRSEEFSFEQHKAWLANKLADPDVRIWIALENGMPLGQVRYQKVVYGKELWTGGPVATPAIEASMAEVSIAIGDGWRGLGWGRTLLSATAGWVRKELEVRTLVALVLENNVDSVRTFLKAGYIWEADEERMGKRLWRYTKETK